MKIEELALIHEALLSGESADTFAELCSLLASALIVDNPRFLWHPYGFATHSFGVSSDGSEFRLHVWPDTKRKVQYPHWPIHNHTRSIESCSLVGKAIHCRYILTQDGFSGHRLYSVEHAGDVSTLSTTRDLAYSKPQLVSFEELNPCSWYTLAQNEFHQVMVPEMTLFASLVRFGPQRVATSFVVGDCNGFDRYEYRRDVCESTIVHTLAQKLLGS
jgi:hypothetical protein